MALPSTALLFLFRLLPNSGSLTAGTEGKKGKRGTGKGRNIVLSLADLMRLR